MPSASSVYVNEWFRRVGKPAHEDDYADFDTFGNMVQSCVAKKMWISTDCATVTDESPAWLRRACPARTDSAVKKGGGPARASSAFAFDKIEYAKGSDPSVAWSPVLMTYAMDLLKKTGRKDVK